MTNALATTLTGRSQLAEISTPTDALTVDEQGRLAVGGQPLGALLDTFGSPLSVMVEDTLRRNVRRFRTAFQRHWPATVRVLYAIKANNAPAVVAVLRSEGAGADCFGAGELYAASVAGVDPLHTVANGSNKSDADLAAAITAGAGVNIDAPDEIARLAALVPAGHPPIRIKLRLKVLPADFSELASDSTGKRGDDLRDYLQRKKWGFTLEPATEQVRLALAEPKVRLTGFHLHVPRVTQDPGFLAAWGRQLGAFVAELTRRTGYQPEVLDIGGGWSRQRDPESRSLALNAHSIEEYAGSVLPALLGELDAVPELWIEPGRYLVGNAGVLAGRVGAVREDAGHRWVNTDISTNLLPRIDINGLVHHVLPASKMDSPYGGESIVVGPTCVDSVLARDRELPELERGDVVAVLDAGMYADSVANQFNALPRPAVVLVGPHGVEQIRRRELVHDIFRRDVVPPRLRDAETATPTDLPEGPV